MACVTIMCCNDELTSTMSWVGCLLKDAEIFILFAENSQIFLKLSVITILLTFIYLVALYLLVSKQPTQLIIADGIFNLLDENQQVGWNLFLEKNKRTWLFIREVRVVS